MQSWGTFGRMGVRDTEAYPTKSGVLGLVCAALGRPREESVEDLAALRMGVRIDAPGTVAMDYHTAGGGAGPDGRSGVVKADGKSGDTVLSSRFYLADADFLVGLEGDRGLLERIEVALHRPVWQLSLGRKAFVPGVPVFLPGGGLRDGDVEAVLGAEPWPLLPAREQRPRAADQAVSLMLWIEDPAGRTTRLDQPVGRAFLERTFAPRRLRDEVVAPPQRPLADSMEVG